MSRSALQDVIALLGSPAAGEPAQYLFDRGLVASGLDMQFVTLEVRPEHLAAALAGIEAMGFRGCLLSGRLRHDAATLLQRLSPAARFAAGASLVERNEEGLFGDMTDGRGVVEALRRHVDPGAASVLLLGGGTAARAVALELALAGARELIVCDRDPERGGVLVEAIGGLGMATVSCLPWSPTIEVPGRVGIVVAAVPEAGCPTLGQLRDDLVVADLSLAPERSAILQATRTAGGCSVNGLEIQVAKMMIDFQRLTGREADEDLLRDALDEFLDA
jgi:shikimate dehydrogenase